MYESPPPPSIAPSGPFGCWKYKVIMYRITATIQQLDMEIAYFAIGLTISFLKTILRLLLPSICIAFCTNRFVSQLHHQQQQQPPPTNNPRLVSQRHTFLASALSTTVAFESQDRE